MTFSHLCFFLSLCVFTVLSAEDWCYDIVKSSGKNCKGPREWVETCATGTIQSPINIVTRKAKFDSKLKPFHFVGYENKKSFKLVNNGHSAELSLEGGEFELSGGGLSGTYTAKQLHFHWGSSEIFGSEHSLDGERYPIELHVVHSVKTSARSEPAGGSTPAQSGSTAVLGFFIEETSTENTNYKGIIDALKLLRNLNSQTQVADVVLRDLIPDEKYLEHFYRYNGSLTTPNCTEGVTWTLFPETIKMGKSQIETFYGSLNYSADSAMVENFRPTQRLGNRIVYTSGVEALLSHSGYLLLSLLLAYVLSAS